MANDASRFPSFDDVMAQRHPEAPWGDCRWCGAAILRPDGTRNVRRRWHKPCQDEMNLRTNWGVMRMHVLSRDGGACRACELDVEGTSVELVGQAAERGCPRVATPLGRLLEGSGFDLSRSLWEVDHVLALADGGRHEVGWLWLLCQVCHKRKTSAEARARAGQDSLSFAVKKARLSEEPADHMAAWVEELRREAQMWR